MLILLITNINTIIIVFVFVTNLKLLLNTLLEKKVKKIKKQNKLFLAFSLPQKVQSKGQSYTYIQM